MRTRVGPDSKTGPEPVITGQHCSLAATGAAVVGGTAADPVSVASKALAQKTQTL